MAGFLPNAALRPEVGKNKEAGLNLKYDGIFAASDSFRGKFNLFRNDIPSGLMFVVIEKLVRIAIFLGYLWLISRMKDLQRVFQYHAGSPIGANTKIATTITSSRKLVPQRG